MSKRSVSKLQILSLALAFIISFSVAGCSGTTAKQETVVSEPEAVSWVDNPTVSYLGPEGTYTEEATRFFFKDSGKLVPKKTVNDAIEDVVSQKSDYAVIPQENTIGGPVTDYLDALISAENIYVAGEVILPISQTLMGVPGAKIEDIKTVCSHVQGIKQSEQWRRENIPEAVTEEMDSTAAAASYVADKKDKTIAAVAAPLAAELYGLDVLAENVQITDANKTRFYVLASEKLPSGENDHAVFVADCGADHIDDVILTIHDAGLEMAAIHDRPTKNALGSYYYLIETQNSGGITQSQIDKITKDEAVRFLGSFDSQEKLPDN